jgi:ribose 5-phosphate isomerase B
MALSADQIYDARRDDDVNVLSISANVQGEEEVLKIVQVFLGTTFSGEERHLRRINKVKEIEERLYK